MDEDEVLNADRLARIEVKLDLVLARYEDHETRIRHLEKGEKTDERITALEKWRWGIPANVLVSLSAIIVACIQYF